ncbi:MAG TPA: 7,8-didemethyl-8-hydroxy-5-deazariboflavin synthase subunit CofH [Candidatus Dormibacteraeota bacterium]|jgi:FO synthase subunit 2|nr:7,8-didemethyl-8-hydroxy-5-deazariboflavin synthase subunit CofH [Candidatus Dormibacteraeota bacterium]
MEALPVVAAERSEPEAVAMPDWATDRLVTYSRSITVDLTYRCLARCGYCEYRQDEGGLISDAEVERLLDAAVAGRCREVLIMAGERPWDLPDVAQELFRRFPARVASAAGEAAFVDLAIDVCRRAMRRGLLPHLNVGVLSAASLARLKPWCVSMGLMLETLRDDLRAHSGTYRKVAATRLAHIAAAGRLRIPFTTGILVGIGEAAEDRRAALEAIAALHREHGHIEEVIVQDFQPKPGTPMADQPAPDEPTMREAVRVARAVLPPEVKVQVPPNLLPGGATADWVDLLDAGARDLGGVSLNSDSVSPSHPWPAIAALERAIEKRGWRPMERLPLYAESTADLRAAADTLRRELVGDEVTYVVNRNVNVTNACVGSCLFCGFRRNPSDGAAYWHDREAIFVKIEDAVRRGATEICMQSGLMPDLDLRFFLELFDDIRTRWPHLHLHALSPEEIRWLASLDRRPVRAVLSDLRAAGLGTMPGTAAEVLVEEVRRVICPNKLDTESWIDVVRTAHSLGIRTTSTLMYGHVETWEHRIRHMQVIRDLQRETGGITEFVLLPFQNEHNPLSRRYAIPPVALAESLKLTALARLYFGADLPNIQTSWVKIGVDGVRESLRWGANDFGGTLMEETISRSSGASHGSNLEVAEIVAAIRAAGRVPRERATDYGPTPPRVADRGPGAISRPAPHDPSLARRAAHPNLARLKPLDPAVARQA